MFILWSIIPICFLLFLLLLFLLFIMNKTNSWNFSKFYFSIVSIWSVIGMVIAFGTALYSGITNAIITDEEYLLWRNSREMTECSNDRYLEKPKIVDWIETYTQKKTPEEIIICEDKAKNTALAQRSLTKKETITWGLVRGILFTILFMTHFPRMRKED